MQKLLQWQQVHKIKYKTLIEGDEQVSFLYCYKISNMIKYRMGELHEPLYEQYRMGELHEPLYEKIKQNDLRAYKKRISEI